VELHDLAVQRNVQSSSRDRDLNVIRVRSLVSPPDRFHVYAPIPHDGFGVDYVSKMWPHEKLLVVGGGKRRFDFCYRNCHRTDYRHRRGYSFRNSSGSLAILAAIRRAYC
jgi:hypothetical protein